MITISEKINLAIFASGGGSNAFRILEHFRDNPYFSITLIVFNNKKAGVQLFGPEFDVPAVYWNKSAMEDSETTLKMLDYYGVDGIILAGYLALVPSYLINAFENKILNIHPALLPEFGGQGMYGHFVHEAVSRSGQDQSGITIHLVNKEFDKGEIIFQQRIPILPFQDPEVIQKAVLALEHEHYAGVIEQYFTNLIRI